MVKWSKVCRSKKKGGLGILDLQKQNISLLCKWWWKLETQHGLWQDIIKAKYLKIRQLPLFPINLMTHLSGNPCSKLKTPTWLGGKLT
jgi:hypothetical protein